MTIDNARTAREGLEAAKNLKRKVLTKGVDERKIAIGWALFNLVFVSLFDFLPLKTAGFVILFAAAGGIFVTLFYVFSTRMRVNTMKQRSSTIWFWTLYTLCFVGLFNLTFISNKLNWDQTVPFTAVAIASVIPLIIYAAVKKK